MTMPEVSVSVVICAYTDRRWDQLLMAIDSAQEQLLGGDEIIVVIDHNDELLTKVQAEYPGIVVIPNEFGRGASGGRNTGDQAARGDVLVFLDDDAVAETGWLAAHRAWYLDPAVVAVGGRAVPRWEGGRAPQWLPRSFFWVVGCSYDGQPTQSTPVRNVWACNMSVRRSAFAAVGGFNLTIGGVAAGVTQGCEETELCIRLGAHGSVMYDPGSSVSHFVPQERQHLRYFVQRCRNEGRSKSLVSRSVGRDAATAVEGSYLRTVVLNAVKQLVTGALRLRRFEVAQALVAVVGIAVTGAEFERSSFVLRRSQPATS
jgi:GT2 family glycosyltransferase